jgi:hypothetical protein
MPQPTDKERIKALTQRIDRLEAKIKGMSSIEPKAIEAHMTSLPEPEITPIAIPEPPKNLTSKASPEAESLYKLSARTMGVPKQEIQVSFKHLELQSEISGNPQTEVIITQSYVNHPLGYLFVGAQLTFMMEAWYKELFKEDWFNRGEMDGSSQAANELKKLMTKVRQWLDDTLKALSENQKPHDEA